MAIKTLIAWTDHTFNIAWGCQKISPGCANCYALTLSKRYGHDVFGPTMPRRVFGEKHWREPIGWQRQAEKDERPHRVFTSSMGDVFEDHPTIDAERLKLWDIIVKTPDLDWQVLTKRADRIADHLPLGWTEEGWPNVWLGVSVEDRKHGFPRIDRLREIPAVVRFLSVEPLLEDLGEINLTGIDWVIVGGESGPGYRPMPHEWARNLMDQCHAQGAAFFFKQSAAARTEMGIELEGRGIVREFPTPRAGRAPMRMLGAKLGQLIRTP